MSIIALVKDCIELLSNSGLSELIIEKPGMVIAVRKYEVDNISYSEPDYVLEMLTSEVIGWIKEINSIPGNNYLANDVLIKVELPFVKELVHIVAPADIEVVDVFVKEGEAVDYGKPLLSFKKI